ncbi:MULTISPECIES: DUF4430 domain-containing protein [unclassified Sporosarcina]|uniref:DUF4430 domain-containing protein n=1 Tax=unclassified Sporosarcina TaxID=2647733 RepID=UPI000C16B92B|nr:MULTISPECIES: DUF4430 domain-containing protein [unclassified Sporosarcina]PID05506.1 hypothetical protein CSV66_09820 [Sporosarcina sp. P30]PID08653.1 hypothetical protein CSV65_09545 [Sporosarcina sp. P31]PID11655.1 hypothetical protein CSV64_10510 [Sporosarcina sp. P32b]
MKKTKTAFMKYRNYMYYSLIVLLLFSTITYATISHEQAATFNFNEKVEASSLKLAGGGSDPSDTEPDQTIKSDTDEIDSSKSQEPTNTDKPKEEPEEKPQDNRNIQPEPQNQPLDKPGTTNAPDNTPKPNTNDKSQTPAGSNNKPLPEKTKPNPNTEIEIVDVADRQNRYFTTNIKNNETVTDPQYVVTVNHLNDSLIPQEMNVKLNGKQLNDFTGGITLIEGTNDIQFQVTYKQSDKKVLRVSQSYRVMLNSDDIIITTDLKDQTVIEEILTFTATAAQGEKDVKLKVFSNDQELKPLAGNAYTATLAEGKNTIKLTAQLHGKKAEQIYTVIYEKEKITISLKTDLKDQQANSAKFSFYAKATASKVDVPLKITVNDQLAKSLDGSNYSVQLINGTNTIKVVGQYEDEQLERQYIITYKDPNVNEKPQVDPDAPKLVTDLKSGSTVKGDIKTINVWPVTASGERIRGKNVQVQVNGENIPFTWDDSSKTSYKLTLQTGQNNVTIKVWDDEGRTVTETFTVTSVAPAEDGVIGQVTISLEASVLGIPYLIKPTKMDIHQGERGSYILDQLLRNNGYEYGKTGNLDSSFYLRDVSKPGMLNGLHIPDDLWEVVEQVSTTSNRDIYSPDSLSEFDFANGSGWMYSVNGDYPNYGFSDAYFLDGDVVRVRYTLHYGKDIGGHDSSGDSEANWNKEW